jgi:hypothetical protein
MTDKRVRELAPLVVQSAAELAGIWPLRARVADPPGRSDVAAAA